MNLGPTERVKPLIAAVRAIVRDEIIPSRRNTRPRSAATATASSRPPRMTEIFDELKAQAARAGLWNFWLTDSDKGYGLTTVEYAYLAEEMGWSPLAAEVFNCSAPDTGNMEVLERFGSPEQKARWLPDLLEGRARSAYLMTEPGVASSDATNIAMEARLEGEEWVLNGEKWWSSGAGDPRCSLYITMAVTDPDAPRHARHSMFFVPADTPGIEKLRAMKVYGADDAPHGHLHIRFTDVRVPKDAIVARPRPRLRDRAGAARARPHPSLHARDRPGRAGARGDVPARGGARGVRPEARSARRQPRHHRRSAHEHRDGAAALPEGRLGDGHAGQPRRRVADLADQGDRAADRARSDRSGGADARRRPASARTSRSRACGRACARCGSPMGPTPCIGASSPRPS